MLESKGIYTRLHIICIVYLLLLPYVHTWTASIQCRLLHNVAIANLLNVIDAKQYTVEKRNIKTILLCARV